MKRKMKLLSSVFSLALAFALMSFGVYAAAVQRTPTVTGSISFTAGNLDADVTVKYKEVSSTPHGTPDASQYGLTPLIWNRINSW